MSATVDLCDRILNEDHQFLTKGFKVFPRLQGSENIEHVLTLSARVGLEDINYDEVQVESRLYH